MAKKMAKNNFSDGLLETDESGEKVRAITKLLLYLPGMGQIKDRLKDLDLNSKGALRGHHYIYDGSRARNQMMKRMQGLRGGKGGLPRNA